jgi:hypothetical protein
VKNLARLVLYFSNVFILSLIAVSGICYLVVWIEAARNIPALPFAPAAALASAARIAIPAALYAAAFLSLNYGARREVPVAMGMAVLFALSLGFSLGASLAQSRLALQAASAGPGIARPTLGESGLRLLQGDVSIIVLGDPADGTSPRIAAVPGQPLVYMAAPRQIRNTPPRLPPVPFHEENSYAVGSLLTDFTLVSEQFEARLGTGFIPFIIYLGSLCLLLVSFYRVFEVTLWPLANMFLGALAFRGLLAFETFIDSDSIQSFIFFFLGRFIPRSVISPVIFALIALLVILYSALIMASRRKDGMPRRSSSAIKSRRIKTSRFQGGRNG